MKKGIVLILLAALLGACTPPAPASSESTSTQPPSQPAVERSSSESAPEPESTSSEPASKTERPPADIKFEVPTYDPIYKNELLNVLGGESGFSHEFLFPEFESVKTLDYTKPTVSSNLMTTGWLNKPLMERLGGGVSSEELAKLEEEKGHSLYGVQRYQDVNAIGQWYFGLDFNFPKGDRGFEMTPVDEAGDYYSLTAERGGMDMYAYLLLDSNEVNGKIEATFLPYRPRVSWDDGTITSIGFSYPDYSGWSELHYLDDAAREAADAVTCLNYCYLNVPQEELGTLTVTFEQQDGRWIAVSSRYNEPLSRSKP